MKWNLRLVAAQKDIWRASELQRRLADYGLEISAGKMSKLWSGNPIMLRLEDIAIICEVLDCQASDLLVRQPGKYQPKQPSQGEIHEQVVGQTGTVRPLRPRHTGGRSLPPT